MKNIKTIISFILVVAMLVSVLAVFSGCGKKEKETTETVDKALDKTMSAIAPFESEFVYDDKSAYKLSFVFDGSKFSVDSTAFNENTANAYLEIISGLFLTLTGRFDSNSAAASLLLKNGGEIFIDGEMFIKGDEIAFGSDTLLGDTVLGTNLKTFMEKFDDSALSDIIGVTTEDFEESGLPEELAPVDVAGLPEKLEDLFEKAIDKNYTEKSTKEEITINGITVKADVITTEINSANIVNMLKKAIEEVKADAELCDMISKYLTYTSGGDVSFVELINENQEMLDEIYSEITATPIAITTRFCTKDGYVILADVVATIDEETYKASASFGADPTNITRIELAVDIDGEKYSIAYVIDENSSSMYKSHLEVNIPSSGITATVQLITFSYNKTTSEFELKAQLPTGQSVTVAGIIKTTKDSVELTLNKVSVTMVGDEGNIAVDVNLGVTFKIEKDSNAIELPTYEEILDLNEEKITEIYTKIAEFTQNLPFVSE